jgi:hypothetical protein
VRLVLATRRTLEGKARSAFQRPVNACSVLERGAYFAGAASAGLSAAGLVVVLFFVVLFLVVVVPFFVFVEVVAEALASVVAGGVAGLASWAKAAKDVARTSALMRFFMGFETPWECWGERG